MFKFVRNWLDERRDNSLQKKAYDMALTLLTTQQLEITGRDQNQFFAKTPGVAWSIQRKEGRAAVVLFHTLSATNERIKEAQEEINRLLRFYALEQFSFIQRTYDPRNIFVRP